MNLQEDIEGVRKGIKVLLRCTQHVDQSLFLHSLECVAARTRKTERLVNSVRDESC